MRLAEVSTRSVHVPDEVWRAAHEQLGDRRTVELMFNIGLYNMVARLIGAADVGIEAGFDRDRGRHG